MIPIPRIPDHIPRGDWQVILAHSEYQNAKMTAYHLRITDKRVYAVLKKYESKFLYDALKEWREQIVAA